MNCKEFQEKISLYIDNELNNIENKEFELHLFKCEDCQREYSAMIDVLKILNDTEDEELPEEFKSNLRAGLVKAKEENFKSRKNLRIITSVAASFIIFLVSYGLINNHNLFNKGVKEESPSEISQLDTADFEEGEMKESRNNDEVVEDLGTENRYGITGTTEKLSPQLTTGDDSFVTMDVASDKIILRKGNVNIKVTNSEVALNSIKGNIKDREIEIENLSINNDNIMKNVNLTLSLKDEYLEETLQEIENLGELIDSNIIKMDIEDEIVNIKNNIKNLKLQEEKLKTLLEENENINERLEIEKEITRIRTLIDNYTFKISRYESNEINSTLDVNMRETDKN